MYEDALAMNPGSKEAVLHLYTAMQELIDWDDLDIMFERVVNATQLQLAQGTIVFVYVCVCVNVCIHTRRHTHNNAHLLILVHT